MGTREIQVNLSSFVKLGTSSIVHETTHQPLLSTLSSIVETVVQLKRQGHKVVLVSSGAIGVGLKRMDIPNRPKSLSGKQVGSTSTGNGLLIERITGIGSDWARKINRIMG